MVAGASRGRPWPGHTDLLGRPRTARAPAMRLQGRIRPVASAMDARETILPPQAQEAHTMTDYERTTRQTTTTDPAYDPRAATTTTEARYRSSGPGAAATISRFVMFLFGVLQVALILRVILLLLV